MKRPGMVGGGDTRRERDGKEMNVGRKEICRRQEGKKENQRKNGGEGK